MTAGATQLVAATDYKDYSLPTNRVGWRRPPRCGSRAGAKTFALRLTVRRSVPLKIKTHIRRSREQGNVCPVMIAERRAFARALTGGLAVTEFDPLGKGADEMRELWQWQPSKCR